MSDASCHEAALLAPVFLSPQAEGTAEESGDLASVLLATRSFLAMDKGSYSFRSLGFFFFFLMLICNSGIKTQIP